MHQPLGTAFASCSEHVLGHKPDLTVFDVPADGEPETLSVELADLLQQTSDGQGTLVLCDIFGATPFNIAKRAIKLAAERGHSAHLITGTNLCMVLKALTERQDNPEQLSRNIQLGAQKGIVNADHECKC